MILLTNDDGIDAPGLFALEQSLVEMGQEAVVVAPLEAMSECSHRVTTKGPLAIHAFEERRGHGVRLRRFAVDGTPADCVRVALLHVLPELGVRVEEVRVFSGINLGGNLGADIYISGTVAAVREAAFFGVPGVAFSQYRQAAPTEEQWRRAAGSVRRVVEVIDRETLGRGEFWNVNFPWLEENAAAAEIVMCERSRRPLPVKYEELLAGPEEVRRVQYVTGLYHTREYEAGSDIEVCFGGRIAVTRVAI